MEATKPGVVFVVCPDGGEIKLPVGFRFRPTDEELLVHYLKRKVLSVPLPARVIPELDVFETDPQSLPGDSREKRWFFSRRSGRRNVAIRDGFGYWKLTGKEKRIVASGNGQVIGTRRTMVFRQGKGLVGRAGQRWIMHELRLPSAQSASSSHSARSGIEMIRPMVTGQGEWAVYKVFQKRRKQLEPMKSKRSGRTVIDFANEVEDSIVVGHGSEHLPPPLSPSSSSSSSCD